VDFFLELGFPTKKFKAFRIFVGPHVGLFIQKGKNSRPLNEEYFKEVNIRKSNRKRNN